MVQTEQILQNRYQLRETLGQNASCQTWLAQDVRIQERVVLKLLTFSDRVQWDNLRLFEREAQVLKHLNHPRIPKYRDYFSIDDRMLWFGLVQEYIPGASLKEVLALGKTFSEQEVRAIAQQVLNILIYLHGLSPPVLHRDIKPSNLIWGTPPSQSGVFPNSEETGEVYLVDFGAVQDRAAAEGATFTIVGTYGYVPLEQLGGRATPASDLYALGATLIHLLTGVAPADLPQREGRIQFADRVRLNPGFVRWIEKLTEPNRSQRFSTAQEALDALIENQMANFAAKRGSLQQPTRAKPSSSRIQLKKSPTHLKISIPVRWFRALTHPKQLAVGVGLGFWSWFLVNFASLLMNLGQISQVWLYLSWLILGILFAGWLVLPAFGETTIYFNHQFFEIEWKLFGFCLRRQRGSILAIDRVFKSDTRGLFNKKFPEVTLAIGVREYVFGGFDPPLTHAECYWLMEEIKSWLGLS
jgi:serine/threonine protein kinase